MNNPGNKNSHDNIYYCNIKHSVRMQTSIDFTKQSTIITEHIRFYLYRVFLKKNKKGSQKRITNSKYLSIIYQSIQSINFLSTNLNLDQIENQKQKQKQPKPKHKK